MVRLFYIILFVCVLAQSRGATTAQTGQTVTTQTTFLSTGGSASFDVFFKYPDVPGDYPVLIWFNGFQSQYSWYTTLLNSVVSNGYISVAYQVPGMMSVATEMETRVNPVLQWITSGSLQAVLPSTIRANTSSIFAAGHSRGGKVASLTYTSHSEVVNAVLVDPVDSSVFSPISADNPSAVEALRASGKTISVVGAGVTGSCNPAQGNYAQFYDAGAAGSWELVIAEAGHAQFLDAGGLMNRIQDTLCGSGSESRAEVADLVAADMVAWFSGNAGTRASFIDTVRQEEGVQFRVKG